MRPYFERDGITIYHGDCRGILPTLALQPDLVLADPQYGTGTRVDNGRFSGGTKTFGRTSVAERIPVHGDKEPFDPSHLLQFKRLVLWGANNYAARLPDSNGWIVWDKRVGLEDMTGWPLGEGELAWTNVTGAVRFWRNRWMGLVRGDERGEFYHPTQKPVALMEWIIGKWTSAGDLILDPYMGAGSAIIAARNKSRRAIGIEIEEKYCEIAARRLDQGVLELGA